MDMCMYIYIHTGRCSWMNWLHQQNDIRVFMEYDIGLFIDYDIGIKWDWNMTPSDVKGGWKITQKPTVYVP